MRKEDSSTLFDKKSNDGLVRVTLQVDNDGFHSQRESKTAHSEKAECVASIVASTFGRKQVSHNNVVIMFGSAINENPVVGSDHSQRTGHGGPYFFGLDFSKHSMPAERHTPLPDDCCRIVVSCALPPKNEGLCGFFEPVLQHTDNIRGISFFPLGIEQCLH
jgi:hypothetical protein